MRTRIRFRQRITKYRTRIALLPISEKKQLILGDKKNIKKKTSLFQEITNIFPAMFFIACFFSLPSLTFCQIDQKFFLFRRPH